MSFYRTLIAIVAAMGLTTVAFAADETTNTTTQNPTGQAASTTNTATTTENTATTGQKLDINKATVKELSKVNGINGAKARAIVNYRKKHGDFKNLDDLKEVKGFQKVDEKTMKEIQDQLTVG